MPATTRDATRTGPTRRPSRVQPPTPDGRLRSLLDRLPRPERHPLRRLFGDSSGVRAIVLTILALMALLLVRPMMMSALSWHRTAGLLNERQAEVASLRSRNAQLHSRLTYYRTDAFVAERAREYGLVMPGETPFVVRELVHPELVGTYARTQLANATLAQSGTPLPTHSTATTRMESTSRIPGATQ